MSRSNAQAAAKTHRAPPPALVRKARNASEHVPTSPARLRLVAIGAAPATIPTRDQSKAKAKQRPASPHISMGQFLRAAVVICAACLAVAFPPPGFEKPSAATAVIDANSVVVGR